MMQTEDCAHAAFEAARRGDRDSVIAVLEDVVNRGTETIQAVSRCWINRTLTVLHHTGIDMIDVALRVTVEPEHGDAGSRRPLSEAPAEVRWVGGVFSAHALGEHARWDKLWEQLWIETEVADDVNEVTIRLHLLVATMARTATRYAEQSDPKLRATHTDCDTHQVTSRMEPMTVGDRTAVAHLN